MSHFRMNRIYWHLFFIKFVIISHWSIKMMVNKWENYDWSIFWALEIKKSFNRRKKQERRDETTHIYKFDMNKKKNYPGSLFRCKTPSNYPSISFFVLVHLFLTLTSKTHKRRHQKIYNKWTITDIIIIINGFAHLFHLIFLCLFTQLIELQLINQSKKRNK